MKRTYIILLSVLMMTSCDVINRYRMGDAVVKIGKEALYESDIERVCAGLTGEDSARVADEYIKKWATEVLKYDKALTLVKDKQIDSMVKEYERSLYISNYEEELVSERMPKQVSEDSIKVFYEKFPERFILKDNLLKGLLLVVHKDAPDQQNLKKWLGNLSDENMENIEKYAYQYASGYELFTEQWQRQSSVLLRLPIAQGNFSEMLRHNNLIEMQDSLSTYLLQVTEKKFAGESMPLEYAAPDIENIILSRRQVEYIRREKDRIYQKALQQNKISFKGISKIPAI